MSEAGLAGFAADGKLGFAKKDEGAAQTAPVRESSTLKA